MPRRKRNTAPPLSQDWPESDPAPRLKIDLDEQPAPDRESSAQARNDGVIKLETIKVRIDHLLELKSIADQATRDYAEAVKATCVDANILPAVLKQFIAARRGEKFAERKNAAQQLSLLFDEVGE